MNKIKWLHNSIVICIVASFCCALWGSSFPFVKIGYKLLGISAKAYQDQILFAGIRFALAGILTILIGSYLSKGVLIPTVKAWPKIVILSILQTILQYTFFYIGLSHTTGVKASVVQGTNVFVALLVAHFLFRQDKLNVDKVLGCISGFVGVIIINLNTSGLNLDFKLIGEGFVFLSTVAYAFSSVMFKQYSKNENAILLSGYQFIIGGGIMILVGYLMGGKIGIYTEKSIGILFYLALVSAVAYTLWALLLKYNSITKVAVYGFMTPVFGVIFSAFMLDEKLTGYKSILALMLVCVGIYIVNKKGIANKPY